jgi:hypothetical protein
MVHRPQSECIMYPSDSAQHSKQGVGNFYIVGCCRRLNITVAKGCTEGLGVSMSPMGVGEAVDGPPPTL